MAYLENIQNYLQLLKNTIDQLDKNEVNKFIELVLEAYRNDRKIYIFGNGGSSLTASHFACDFNKGLSYGSDKRFRVMPLTDNLATIMAYANDVGFDDVFVEQLKNHLEEGDLAIGISGSGNSYNVIKAIEYANSRDNVTIGITGYNGGILKKISRHSVNANINDMQVSEDIHMILCHMAMRVIEDSIKQKNEAGPVEKNINVIMW